MGYLDLFYSDAFFSSYIFFFVEIRNCVKLVVFACFRSPLSHQVQVLNHGSAAAAI